MAALRFDLEGVVIDGSLNSFKNPQLVLKTQHGQAPRVPYTGIRSRLSARRHILMVHVKDKATELEMLDLSAFASPPEPDQTTTRFVKYFPLKSALVFQYPKGPSNKKCTLQLRFRGSSDINTVISELVTLGINIESTDSSGQFGSLDAHEATAVPTNLQGWRTPYLANPAYQLAPVRPPSRPTLKDANLPPVWPAMGPSPRPATTLGIPGMLGEGLYKVSRVASALGPPTRVRRSARLSDFQGPRLYTVSKYFDATLDRSGDVRSLNRHLLGHGGGPDMPTDGAAAPWDQNSTRKPSDAFTIRNAGGEEHSGDSSQSRNMSQAHTPGAGTSQSASISRQSSSSQKLDAASQQRASLYQGIAVGLDREPQYMTNYRPASAHPQEGITTTIGKSIGKQPRLQAPLHIGGSRITDETLSLAFGYGHEGLLEATKLWEDLMEKGRKEAELVESLEDAHKIWSHYGEVWARQLNDITSMVARKMRNAAADGAS